MKRFYDQVDSSGSCWTWKGRLNSRGSGIFKVKDRLFTAKQYSFYLKYGYVPKGKCLQSSCNNPLCVNPEHLKVVDELGPERLFWPKVKKTTQGCWEWTASQFAGGYGKFSQATRYNRSPYAHIFSYQLHYTDYDKSKMVCHKCDNKLCVNPDHLFLGTAQDNTDDMISKSRNHTRVKEEEVKRIREDTRTLKLIAKDYGLSHQQVSNIKRRKSWRHI